MNEGLRPPRTRQGQGWRDERERNREKRQWWKDTGETKDQREREGEKKLHRWRERERGEVRREEEQRDEGGGCWYRSPETLNPGKWECPRASQTKNDEQCVFVCVHHSHRTGYLVADWDRSQMEGEEMSLGTPDNKNWQIIIYCIWFIYSLLLAYSKILTWQP